MISALLPTTAWANPCIAPERPFVPQAPDDIRAYTELLGQDFERYFADVQAYFRCLDLERARALAEARAVSEDYARFLRSRDQ